MKVVTQKNTFAGDVLTMATAPLFTQILGIILMPIVTRLYTPEAYGGYSVFGSILMPICILATMGYSGSIVLPENDEEASNMLCVSITFTLVLTIFTLLFFLLGSDLLLRWLKVPELNVYLWMLPVSVFLYGLQMSLLSWNLRYKRFGRIAISKISLAVTNKAVLIGAGFSGFPSTGSLLMGGIVSSMTSNGILGKRIWHESNKLFKHSIKWHEMIQGIKRYRKFPMYNLGTDFISRLSSLMVVFLLTYYFSKSAVGFYGLGVAVLSIPATFIGSSIGEVFYQRAAAARHEDLTASSAENLFERMTWMSMLIFLFLALIGDSLFAFVFGVKWLEAGVYGQILSFSIFINFVMGPALVLVNVLEKQEINLIVYIVTTIMSAISIVVGGVFNNVYIALGLFSLFNGLTVFAAGLLMLHFAGVTLSKIFITLLKCFLSCVPIIILVAMAKWYFGAFSLVLIVISVICGIIYYAILFKEDKLLHSMLVTVLGKMTSRILPRTDLD